jgi:hypothetical protein
MSVGTFAVLVLVAAGFCGAQVLIVTSLRGRRATVRRDGEA